MDPIEDATGAPVQWVAGQKYLIQMDMNNNGGGWDMHLGVAASSTGANAKGQQYDTLARAPLDPGDVLAPVPAFKTIDLANPIFARLG